MSAEIQHFVNVDLKEITELLNFINALELNYCGYKYEYKY